LTLVLPRVDGCKVSLLCSAGLETLAVRIPGASVARRIIETAGVPVAAPSANRSGQLSPTTAAHVVASLGARIPLVVDGGPCPVGLESTVLDLSGGEPVILRPGGLAEEHIAGLIGPLGRHVPAAGPEPPGLKSLGLKSPGLLASHYAPRLPLRLNAREARPGEALLAFGPRPPEGAKETANLSASSDLAEAAANLFAMLHALDRPEFSGIAVMPIPDTGLGRAALPRA
jgi:L-threonylcarbamoyladenylate synthase